MKIFSWQDILRAHIPQSPCFGFFTGSALTVGGFDGPHIVHRALCTGVLEYAKAENLQSGVITFARSPRFTKQKDNYAGDISTLRLRLEKFEQWGFDFVVAIDFSCDFSRMEGVAFLQTLLEQCAMRFLSVGQGFRCGYKGTEHTKGIESFVTEHNCKFRLAPLVNVASEHISSSLIRQYIVSGELQKTAKLLDRNFMLDMQDTAWVYKKHDCNFFYLTAERSDIMQVMPPNGIYRVTITTHKTKAEFSALLHVESSNLRLEVPCIYENAEFDVIAFEADKNL